MANKKKSELTVKEATAALAIPSEMKGLYEANKDLGTEDMSAKAKVLKVHYSNQSKNELPDGSEPANGAFFYTDTKEQFEEVECSILSISRKFAAKKYQSEDLQDNQILAGYIREGGLPNTDKPFLLFLKGMTRRPDASLWEFMNEVRDLKKMSIPMFALTVKLTTNKHKANTGNQVWVVDFEIVKKGDAPEMVAEPGIFTFLKDATEAVKIELEEKVSRKISESEMGGDVVEAQVVEEAPHPGDAERPL